MKRMKRENGRVIIDISEDEYQWLIFALGAATATLGPPVLKLDNAINEGNPAWTPYPIK